ncbi:GAF domain-containing sensor histidine kinase [Pantanalinema sp. GBBB05]|uniref:GAF domain-containing sensor histidine kinase n=1 Tax=Pantanalinema sp. GBBB05 TaxID=2604139 RepID=UPI001D8D8B8B|nr:GAF domain-containing sensor histidine kinase [Pantanalinema sp. GBBB05]
MVSQDHRLFCRLDGLTVTAREQQRTRVMTDLGFLEAESIPVFDETTQTAAHFLRIPICILGLMDADRQRFKSAVGLSRLGLMNELATSRQLPRLETFCTHVVDSQQVLVIQDTLTHPAFANSVLVHQYGIRAYLGVPLMTSNSYCLGTLAVMDTTPRSFTDQDIEFLQLMARWSISEFERQQATLHQVSSSLPMVDRKVVAEPSPATQLKVELLSQLTQELRTPLTSVMGMASVLNREIYGPLTNKQKEYLNIIHHSGQYLLSLVNEILELSEIEDINQRLNLSSVDIEMLCQQAINTLEQAAQRREQQIRLSVEPGRRIWLLDKDKVRQLLYHLVFSVIQSSTAGSVVRLHVSRRDQSLNIAVWVSHPWLGEGLPFTEIHHQPSLVAASTSSEAALYDNYRSLETGAMDLSENLYRIALEDKTPESRPQLSSVADATDDAEMPRKNLALLLSRQLAELHGGYITIQGTPESGYRYVISLPQPGD